LQRAFYTRLEKMELLKSVFALFAIKAIFDDDAHKIVSEQGRRVLADPEKMKLVDLEMEKFKRGEVEEIVIDLS